MMGVTMTVIAVRMMNMLLMKELRRWRYLARYGYAGAVLQILILRHRVHLVLLAGRRRLAGITAVVNVYLPA